MLKKTYVSLMTLAVSSAIVFVAPMLQTKPVEAGQGYRLPFPAGKNVPINQSCVDSIDGIGCNHSGYPSIKYAVDFGCNLGDAVVAIQDGRVAKKGFNGTGYEGYGNYVVIEHPNGKGSLYAHLQEASNVNVNDNIKRGQQVGKCGGTTSVGKTFPVHLHLELRPQWNTWSTEKIYFDECDNNSNCRDGQVYYPKSYISQNSIANPPANPSVGITWQQLSGSAKDIGIGANGTVWVIGTNPVSGGYGIYKWNGSGWQGIDGGALRIAVDKSGTPWVVNSSGNIFRRTPNGWQMLSGLAKDIGIGADGTVWVIGTNSVPGGYSVYKWNGSGWQGFSGGAENISVDSSGNPWVVNNVGSIFKGKL